MNTIRDIFSRAFPNEHLIGDSFAGQPRPNYWIVYGTSGIPRWLIPQDPHIGLPVLKQWHPFQLLSMLKWKALLGTYRAGLLGRLPGIVPIHLKEIQWPESSGIPVFYIGTPSHVSKLVITLVDPTTTKPTSILKLPVGENASSNILHEATILEQLSKWKPGFCPNLLSVIPEHGRSLQEALVGTIAGLKLTGDHFQLFRDLRYQGQFTTLTEQLVALDTKYQALHLSNEQRAIYQEIRTFLQDETEVPQFWHHGDFSPWNVLRCKAAAQLIDWERSRPKGLPLLDFFHFLAMQRLIRNEPVPPDLNRHPVVNQYLEQCDIYLSDDLLKKLYLYYRTEHWLNANWEEASLYGPPAFRQMLTCWEAVR